MKNILIIGDSTSSSLGGFSENWLRKIGTTSVWGEQVRFIDTCAPGVTAGAALFVFIKKLFVLRFSISLVVLSVGNCDRIDRPYMANRTYILRILFFLTKSLIRFKTRKKLNWTKLDFSEWQSIDLDQSKQKVENFDKCLRFIKFLAKVFRINLFVIIPRSNLHFPPATAKNNSIFYDLVNFGDSQYPKNLLNIPDLSDSNLLSQSNNSMSLTPLHYSNLAIFELYDKHKVMCSLNNFAVQSFNAKQIDLSLNILEQLNVGSDSASEFFCYNMAKIYLEIGDQNKSSKFFQESLRLDTYSYRVDSVYSDTVRRIFHNSTKVRTLDLYDAKFDDHFLDHCHLLSEGQDLIMNAIHDYLISFLPTGDKRSFLTVEPINPETSEGDLRSFNEVFGIETPIYSDKQLFQGRAHSIDVVADHLEKFLFKSKNIEITESALFYAFTSQELKTDSAYLNQIIEKERNRIENLATQLRISLPKIDCINLPRDLSKAWLDEILKNLHLEMKSYIYAKNSCAHRMRTIMTWYFKESLFFGFNSSSEMLYIRNDIRRWKEALCLALSLNYIQNFSILDRISKYIDIVSVLEASLSAAYSDLDFLKLSQSSINELEFNIGLNSKRIWERNFE